MESKDRSDGTAMDTTADVGSGHESQKTLPTDHAVPLPSAAQDASAARVKQTQLSSELLRTTYLSTFEVDDTPNAVRLDHGKAFALALLRQNYPESKGYLVKPSSLGPLVRNGLSLMLKADDGSDPSYVAPEPRSKKSKKKKLSKAQREQVRIEDYVEAFNHSMDFTMSIKWDFIESEDITGFVVLAKCTVNESTTHDEYRLRTYLALVIDDLANFSELAATNDVHRSDILTDALSRNAEVQRGYGILLYGSRLEFYNFDNKAETVINSEDGVKGTVSMEDPALTLCAADLGKGMQDLAFDLRTTSLDVVNRVFATHIVPWQVTYSEVDEAAGGDEASGGDEAVDAKEEAEDDEVDGIFDSDAK